MSKLYVELTVASDGDEILRTMKYVRHVPGTTTFPLIPGSGSFVKLLEQNGFERVGDGT